MEESGRGWKRTTVRTFLTRPDGKGLLTAVRRGKNCEYRAAVTEEEYLSGQARNFVDEVFGGNVKICWPRSWDRKKWGADDVKELQAFWEKCREDVK